MLKRTVTVLVSFFTSRVEKRRPRRQSSLIDNIMSTLDGVPSHATFPFLDQYQGHIKQILIFVKELLYFVFD